MGSASTGRGEYPLPVAGYHPKRGHSMANLKAQRRLHERPMRRRSRSRRHGTGHWFSPVFRAVGLGWGVPPPIRPVFAGKVCIVLTQTKQVECTPRLRSPRRRRAASLAASPRRRPLRLGGGSGGDK